jgi:hypothetical protein
MSMIEFFNVYLRLSEQFDLSVFLFTPNDPQYGQEPHLLSYLHHA